MKIIILGNIGTGKSTMTRLLAKVYNWEIVAIDEFRRKYGNNTVESEFFAREQFYNSLHLQKDQIIECTEIGLVADRVIKILNDSDELKICVILSASTSTRKARLKKRVWDVPFLKSLGDIEGFMRKNDDELNNGSILTKWRQLPNCKVEIKKNESFQNLYWIINYVKKKLI